MKEGGRGEAREGLAVSERARVRARARVREREDARAGRHQPAQKAGP